MAQLDCLVRVSRVGGRAGDSFQSPAAQKDACRRDADAHGHRILRTFEELDVSGGARVRPGLDEILRRIERGESQGVIVARIDRFSRSLTGALTAIDRIEKAGGEIVSVAEKFDTTTPIGRAMMRILLVLAELYRDQQTEAFRESRARAIARGVHVTSRVPFGYQRRDGRGHPLEPHPDHALLVAEIFDRRAAGDTYASIYRWLNELGVATGSGGQWTTVNLSQLVGNRVYLGEARSGDIVNPAAHPPLVERAVWERAQATASRTPGRERRSLLAGIIRCAGCRRALTGGGSVAYFCHGQHAAGRCPEPASIRQRFADEHVQRAFLERAGRLELGLAASTGELDAARARLDRAEAEVAAWRDTVSVLDVGADTYRAGLMARQRSVEEALGVFRDVAARHGHNTGLPDVGSVAGLWDGLGVAERRRVLSASIDVVFLRGGRRPAGERLWICWRGEGPGDLPRPARVTPIVPFRFPELDEA